MKEESDKVQPAFDPALVHRPKHGIIFADGVLSFPPQVADRLGLAEALGLALLARIFPELPLVPLGRVTVSGKCGNE